MLKIEGYQRERLAFCTSSLLKCSRMDPAVGMSRALSAPTIVSMSSASTGPVITCTTRPVWECIPSVKRTHMFGLDVLLVCLHGR